MNEVTVVAWLAEAAPGSPLEPVAITPVPWGCWIPSLLGNHLVWWTPLYVLRRDISGRTGSKTEGARSAWAEITIEARVWNNRIVATRCTRDGLNRCIIFSGTRQREHSNTAWESSLYQCSTDQLVTSRSFSWKRSVSWANVLHACTEKTYAPNPSNNRRTVQAGLVYIQSSCIRIYSRQDFAKLLRIPTFIPDL